MEVAAACLSELFGDGEAEVAPLGVGGCDVPTRGFNALGYGFDVIVRG